LFAGIIKHQSETAQKEIFKSHLIKI
jgi:hypothetical protein